MPPGNVVQEKVTMTIRLTSVRRQLQVAEIDADKLKDVLLVLLKGVEDVMVTKLSDPATAEAVVTPSTTKPASAVKETVDGDSFSLTLTNLYGDGILISSKGMSKYVVVASPSPPPPVPPPSIPPPAPPPAPKGPAAGLKKDDDDFPIVAVIVPAVVAALVLFGGIAFGVYYKVKKRREAPSVVLSVPVAISGTKGSSAGARTSAGDVPSVVADADAVPEKDEDARYV